MHSLRPDRGQSVEKPWNDFSRAWNDLFRGWKSLSRAWTGVPEFSTEFIFSAAKFWIPQNRSTIWVSIWVLLMAQEFKNTQF